MEVAGAYQNEREDKNLVLHLGKRQGTNERKIKRSTRKEKKLEARWNETKDNL